MIQRTSILVLALLLSLEALFLPTQRKEQPPAQTPPGQSTYTFQTNTRVVLTDVTVTDADGNPIHGLPQSLFHVFDNKQPQVIASLEEHAGLPAATLQPASMAGVYSNDYLLHLPPVLNIVLIDIANIDMADQMYLDYELTRFLNEQPEGQPLAIYLRAGSGCFLVQDFTSNRKLLLDGLHKAIPRFLPLGSEYLTDFDTLRQMAGSLSQLPGRKNVLWFSGGSTLFLNSDAIALQNDAAWRSLYDALDQERIAIDPIDARGLDLSRARGNVARQHMAMNEVAQFTGGRPFYYNNGLKEITTNLLDADRSFYTLTYSPRNFRFDNKWHKVRIAVDGASYQLSYRRGYFADGSVRDKNENTSPRARLLGNGEKLEVNELREHPIIFKAKVLAELDDATVDPGKFPGLVPLPSRKKGSVRYIICYSLPMDAFAVRPVDGKHKIVLGLAAAALSSDGATAERTAEQV